MGSWTDLVEKLAPAFLSLVAGSLGTKLIVGRQAKQSDLFDRATKELAVRDAVLKLKLAASEPSDEKLIKQIAAKKQAYKQVEALEARLDEQIAALVPELRPDVEWLQNSTYKQKFIPLPPYEGKEGLSLLRRAGWWILLLLFYAGVGGYVFFGYQLAHFFSDEASTHLLNRNPHLFFVELFLIIFCFIGFLISAVGIRRSAYRVASAQVPIEGTRVIE